MDVKEIREALERGLDKEHQKKASDAMECMTTHRWFWRWAQDLESNCKDALSALSAFSAFSTIDPEAIRAEARAEALKEARDAIQDDLDTFRHCGRKDIKGHVRAMMLIDEILADEPVQDDGKPEVFSLSEAWDAFEAGYMQGHNDTVESCVRDSKEAAMDYFSEVKRRIEEAGKC